MNLVAIQAALTDEMQAVLSQPAAVFDILQREQRPIAISLPQAAIQAAEDVKSALNELGIDYRVYAAHKSTNSTALIRALRPYVAIDIASPTELENALQAGYEPENIIATGPKSDHFLSQLAKLDGATISIDSYSELERLVAMAGNKPLSVLLRLTRSLLNPTGTNKKSRFGLDTASLEKALALLQDHPAITLRGVALHLDTQSVGDKQAAIGKAIDVLLDISSHGFANATVLDIGGGFGAGYGINQKASHAFEAMIRESLLENNENTWQSYNYGVRLEDGLMRGELSGINLPRGAWGAKRLIELLSTAGENNGTLADYINDYLIEVWCEPGMTLTSSGGMFIAEVIEVTERDGETMVLINAHRNQICFEGLEHGSDPLLLSRHNTGNKKPCDAFIIGHLCMETDFIVNRKVHFDKAPQAGDLLAWTHTGGYQMHFSASQAIGHPLPAKYTLSTDMTLKEETI